jgi:thioredoxin-like negative regulator of GroEL
VKTLSLIVLVAFGCCWAVHAEIPAGWSTDYTNSLSLALQNQKPALIFFTASWCGPCKLMARSTLSQPEVQSALSNVAPVAIDIDENHDLAARYGIDAVPTFVMLSPSGNEVQRVTGFQGPSDFIPWLANGALAAKQAAIRQSNIENQFAKITQLLASTNSNELNRAAAALIDLCAEHDDKVVQSSVDLLKSLAAKQPVLLLDGLNNSHLAARIQVANILRAQFGDSFGVDPWGDPTIRANTIDLWRARLAAAHPNPPPSP